MTAQKDTISQRQAAALLVLSQGGTVEQAAGLANVRPRQVYRWLQNPAFSDDLMRVRQDALSAAAAKLAGLAGEALEALQAVIRDPAATHADKTRAARVVLDTSLRWAAQLDTERRLERLEQWLDG